MECPPLVGKGGKFPETIKSRRLCVFPPRRLETEFDVISLEDKLKASRISDEQQKVHVTSNSDVVSKATNC